MSLKGLTFCPCRSPRIMRSTRHCSFSAFDASQESIGFFYPLFRSSGVFSSSLRPRLFVVTGCRSPLAGLGLLDPFLDVSFFFRIWHRRLSLDSLLFSIGYFGVRQCQRILRLDPHTKPQLLTRDRSNREFFSLDFITNSRFCIILLSAAKNMVLFFFSPR